MSMSTTGVYWRTIAGASVVGVVSAVGILNVYHLTFALEYSAAVFLDAVKWGAILALASSLFIVIGTLPLARKLRTARGKALFVLMSVVSPIIGWIAVGIITGVLATWLFFFLYPVIGVVSGIIAGVVSGFATFLMPESERGEEPLPEDAALRIFEQSPGESSRTDKAG